MTQPVPSNSVSLRATYDPGAKALYIILPGHPDTPGCVEKTLEDENGVLHDMVGGRVIGLEVLLAEPLEILSGESGETRTGVCYPAGFKIDWDDPSMDAYDDA